MKKIVIFIFSVVYQISIINGQDLSTYIGQNAISVDKSAKSNNDIYNLLKDFNIIMIGEMHGTNEPAQFVIQLTNILTNQNESVQIGLEIPNDLMAKYILEPVDSNIHLSDFFSNNSNDGRASFAWSEIISTLNNNPKVRIFFFDINEGESVKAGDRDSLMFLNIKKEMILHPKMKTITLSGNIHNMILPYKNKPKTALYLKQDQELDISNKICTLNHHYQSGTMLNNIGNGLELREVDYSGSIFSQAVDYESYILLNPKNLIDKHTGIYFTRNVTAANMVKID